MTCATQIDNGFLPPVTSLCYCRSFSLFTAQQQQNADTERYFLVLRIGIKLLFDYG
jgi:hypothetical protein